MFLAGELSVATTVIKLTPATNVTFPFHAVVPVAVTPFTVTNEIPLASAAVPDTVMMDVVKTCPAVGAVTDNDGMVVSGGL